MAPEVYTRDGFRARDAGEEQRTLSRQENKKARPPAGSGFALVGLAVTYFRMRMHTIIGANPFHGPVRDGKEWFQVAIAAR